MGEETTRKFDWKLAGFAAGLLAYVVACFAIVFEASGEIVGEQGFKGLLLGALAGLVAAGIAFLLGSLVGRVASTIRRKALGRIAGALILAVLVGIHAWFFLIPTLKGDPSRYYSTPESMYKVTYTDGRSEVKSGAQMGTERWGFVAGLHTSAGLASAILSLIMLIGGVKGFLRSQ